MKLNASCRSFILVMAVPLLSSCRSAHQQAEVSFDQESFAALMESVAPWPGTATNYPEASWHQLILAAKLVQSAPHGVVEKALRENQLIGCSNGNFQWPGPDSNILDTKLFLLMRTVFDLPENVSANKKPIVFVGAWVGRWMPNTGEINADGTINIGWPVRWNSGHPNLVSGWLGLQGVNARYDAQMEYRYFRGKYHMRDLSSY